ncbi:hypothetical protein [Chroococcidiopsis sp. CCALA 051]|nr:hypothetical protein [Chroococcidiopsis sp. CCALA 051]
MTSYQGEGDRRQDAINCELRIFPITHVSIYWQIAIAVIISLV